MDVNSFFLIMDVPSKNATFFVAIDTHNAADVFYPKLTGLIQTGKYMRFICPLLLLAAMFGGCAGNAAQSAKKIVSAAEYLELGYKHAERGEFDDAVQSYTDALSLNPNMAEAYFCRGLAYIEMFDYSNAVDDFNAVLRIDPNHVNAREALERVPQFSEGVDIEWYRQLMLEELEKAQK
jgi:tetratricopeptide (TPR) repeat protein